MTQPIKAQIPWHGDSAKDMGNIQITGTLDMTSIRVSKSSCKPQKLTTKYQVMPIQSDIENIIAFLGSPIIDDPAITAFLAMVFQLMPCYYAEETRTFNRKVLAWNVAQMKFITQAVGLKITRSAGIRYTLLTLQYRYQDPTCRLWQRANAMYFAYTLSQKVMV